MCGKVKNKPIQGIGSNKGDYPTKVGNHFMKEYQLWVDMLKRCNPTYHSKVLSYVGNTCSENFKSYTFFYEWCQQQKGFGGRESHSLRGSWCLDKDLLTKGNKLYSEDTCVFIPQSVNKLIAKHERQRGDYPIGVNWKKSNNCFIAQCNGRDVGRKHLGCFQTQEDAFLAYKTFKEALIKQVANEYKDLIDPRAYQALLNYTVEITD